MPVLPGGRNSGQKGKKAGQQKKCTGRFKDLRPNLTKSEETGQRKILKRQFF
jgi:hypothetical protein